MRNSIFIAFYKTPVYFVSGFEKSRYDSELHDNETVRNYTKTLIEKDKRAKARYWLVGSRKILVSIISQL